MCDTCPKQQQFAQYQRTPAIVDRHHEQRHIESDDSDDEYEQDMSLPCRESMCTEKLTMTRKCFQNSAGMKVSYLSCDKRQINGQGCYQEDCRPPVLLIHGLGFNATYWTCLAKKLCGACNVFAIDLPCSGESDPWLRDQLTISNLTDLVNDLVGHLSLERLFLVGHGIGSMICLNYAATFPGKVVRLAVSGANPQVFPNPDLTYLFPFNLELIQLFNQALEVGADTCGGAVILSNLLDPFIGPCADPLTAQYANSLDQLRLYQQFLATSNIRPILPNISCPTLIIAGTRDPTTPVGASGLLRETIPLSCLVEVFDAGNNVPIRNTQLYNDTVFNFFFIRSDACQFSLSQMAYNSQSYFLDCNAPLSITSPCLQKCRPDIFPTTPQYYREQVAQPVCNVNNEIEQSSPCRKISIPCKYVR